jgi:hypothetical protein
MTAGRSLHETQFFLAVTLLALLSVAVALQSARGDGVSAADRLEFFESRIRPVLVEHCYECHNSADRAEGGLAVDHRPGLLTGGDSGPILVPGSPATSRLLSILRHEVLGLEMPQGGPQLDAEVVADFARWIEDGAADPRDQPPTADEVAGALSWATKLQQRKQWWSFQPIDAAALDSEPAIGQEHPIDHFLLSRLRDAGLQPAAPADPATLVRRLYFNLIGLPPSRQESIHWTNRLEQASGGDSQRVITQLVDQLLDSPRFGERWARHWMDWLRYAESHGSEGDPANDNAWLYRDYLIRALNADVPYDQLVREQIAGDLLAQPRLNEDLGINESAIGPAHWRMVFHGFAPTDALDEKVRFTDDQINVFSKAFLGLTISCARCHDHKFDAISQQDYYAIYGILASCRPGRSVIDLPERSLRNHAALSSLRPQIRQALAEDWLAAAAGLADQLAASDAAPAIAAHAGSLRQLIADSNGQTDSSAAFGQAWQRRAAAHEQL